MTLPPAIASHIVRCNYHLVDKHSGVGVIDKAVLLLAALEFGPVSLNDLADRTGIPRPTAHRLAVALEHHRLVTRDDAGRFAIGPWLGELGAAAAADDIVLAAAPILTALRDESGESAQLYQRHGDHRVCIAAAERRTGLRDTVPVGAVLTMTAGSAAQVLLAWEDPATVAPILDAARFTARTLTAVRRRGWAQSSEEREVGVGSVSAPVRGRGGDVVAAMSISGPLDRLTRSPGRKHSAQVVAAATRLTDRLAATDSWEHSPESSR